MSDIITLEISSFHGVITALVFLAGGGGIFATIRCSRRRVPTEADPEAVELVVMGIVDGSVTLNVDDATDASD